MSLNYQALGEHTAYTAQAKAAAARRFALLHNLGNALSGAAERADITTLDTWREQLNQIELVDREMHAALARANQAAALCGQPERSIHSLR